VAPSLFAMKGSTHAVHIVSPAIAVYVPGLHLEHAGIPTTYSEKNPFIQTHSVILLGMENGKKILQSMQTAIPSVLIVQICSELHETHFVCPESVIRPVKAKLHSAMCIFIQLCKKTFSHIE